MGYLKNSTAFQVAMEEARLRDENTFEDYASELYLNSRKGLMPKETNETQTPPKGTKQQPHANDH